MTQIYIKHIWKHYELLKSIILDRGLQFILIFWKTVYRILKIKMKLLTAFYSQMNEQNKTVNRKIKQYFWSYVNYQQNNWKKWLLMTEFTENINELAETEHSSFFINFEYELRMKFNIMKISDSQSAWERID